MIYAVSGERAALTRFQRTTEDGKPIWRISYFGPSPSRSGSDSVRPGAPNNLTYTDPAPGEMREPQAFLVEQSPGAVVHPHFHFVDQFQVAVDGGGQLGRHGIAPICVHFAGACTGYGPITPGAGGLKYFTLRASADETGAQFLPANKHKMRKLPKRYVLTKPVLPSAPATLASRSTAQTDTLLDENDGLGASMLRMPPGSLLCTPDPARGSGQSMIVAAGELLHEGSRLGRWSCLFVSAEESPLALHAGPAGAEVLILQYPRKTSL